MLAIANKYLNKHKEIKNLFILNLLLPVLARDQLPRPTQAATIVQAAILQLIGISRMYCTFRQKETMQFNEHQLRECLISRLPVSILLEIIDTVSL